MVAGRYPCMSDIPNMLPDTDMSSRLHMQPAHMRVQCRISFCMPDMHEPSVTPAVTCLGDRLSLKPWGIALKFLFLHHENILFPND